MRPIKQHLRDSRARERDLVRNARHFIAAGDYSQAVRYLTWAIQQQGAADGYETALGIVTARDAMAKAKPVPPRATNTKKGA